MNRVTLPSDPPMAGSEPVALRVLMLGTCQLESIAEAAPLFGHRVDHRLMESLRHSEIPDLGPGFYDAAVVSLTLRHILIEATGQYFGAADMALARVREPEDAAALLERCLAFIACKLDDLHATLAGVPTFFTAFLEPSFNYEGILIDAYAATAPRSILRELNRRFASLVAERTNWFFFDLNDVANAVGRMHLQDDILACSSHGSLISEALLDLDRDRFIVPGPNADVFDYPAYAPAFSELFWRRLSDAVAVLRPRNPVKLIIVDLDDTLWRGVAADSELEPWARIEGWPVGFVEALLFFKRRGGLLAVCSKNERLATLARLPAVWHGAITQDDFVAIRINWRSKAENIAEILAETNILSGNTLFIDDNPRELDEVSARFPEMRLLGGRPQDWRRTILCASATQVSVVTAEATRRTDLVRAGAARKASAPEGGRDAWLASLQLEATIIRVRDSRSRDAVRAFELINKTNQFNTTGRRWTQAEFETFLGDGLCLVLKLKDRTLDNGLVGVSLVRAGEMVQTVLSCRVFGLGAEMALGSVATRLALAQAVPARARILDTGKNATCHTYFTGLGFAAEGAMFTARDACPIPAWIKVHEDDATGAPPPMAVS